MLPGEVEIRLAEPYMALEIACEEDVLSIVTQVRIPSLIKKYVQVRRSSVGFGLAQ